MFPLCRPFPEGRLPCCHRDALWSQTQLNTVRPSRDRQPAKKPLARGRRAGWLACLASVSDGRCDGDDAHARDEYDRISECAGVIRDLEAHRVCSLDAYAQYTGPGWPAS